MRFIAEYRIAESYVHVSRDENTHELHAEIYSSVAGERTGYDMYEIAAVLQQKNNRKDEQFIEHLLMFLASGSSNRSRNPEMFANLAYYASSF